MAEKEVRADYDFFAEIGETYNRSTLAGLLSWVVRNQGRDQDALAWSKIAERTSAVDDIDCQSLWRWIRAPIVARSGNLALAEELGRAALEMARKSEAPCLQADALTELASVMEFAGRHDEAHQLLGEAIDLYSAKGNVVSAERARQYLNRHT